MKRKAIISWSFLFALFAIIQFESVAQTVYEINDDDSEKILFLKDLSVFVDTTNALTFHEVSQNKLSRFKANSSYQNKDFDEDASYWIQIPIRNSASKKVWLMEFFDQTIDELTVYSPMSKGVYERHVLGDHQPFINRENLHKNFTLTLNSSADSTKIYFAKIRSHEFADIRIAIRSFPRFIYYALNEYFLFGTFYGMILIISLYNFMVYTAVREGKYLFYIFYILSVAFYAMSYDGIAFQYLWPAHPEWNDLASGVMLFSLILWAILFTRRFLDTAVNAPVLDKLLVIAVILRTISFLIFLLFEPTLFSLRVLDLIPFSIIFYSAIDVWNKGFKPARFFVIAYGILFLGFFIRLLVYFDVLPLTILSHYSLHLSFVFEMLFLTFALGDRIRIMKANQDKALKLTLEQHQINLELKDKVNKELEAKVHERTLELESKSAALEATNTKLTKQAADINKINAILDLDNWKLKNKVKEVLNEMLLDQTMTYEEFKLLYPDSMSCYRFLESFKWERGFKCSKCGNDKYFNGVKKFHRRCTRCGHNESITANTIFQGVKFPIEKAFYITYITVEAKKTETLAVLSEKLSLPLNTIWNYRTKVSSRLEALNTIKDGGPSKWENVIIQ